MATRWWKRPFWEATQQPLREICDYFGEEIAFYFAWVRDSLAFISFVFIVSSSVPILASGSLFCFRMGASFSSVHWHVSFSPAALPLLSVRVAGRGLRM